MRSAEELLLFLLDERTGALLPVPPRTLDLAFAGAVLMDLQLEDRIDTDLDQLRLSDPTPLGDDLLDPTLADIAATDGVRDAVFWVERTAARGGEIRERATAGLVRQGILAAPEEDGVLAPGAAPGPRCHLSGGRSPREDVRLRVMRVLFDDDIPSPEDVVIIGLADACGVFQKILVPSELIRARERTALVVFRKTLTPSEMAKARERVALVRRMDLISQAVRRLVDVVKPPTRTDARDLSQILPAVRGWPLVGNGLSLAGDVRAFFTKQYLRHGPVFRVRAFRTSWPVLAGPEANVFLSLRERFHLNTGDYVDAFNKELGASRFVLGVDGPEHLRLRRALQDGFSRTRINGRLPEAAEIVRSHVGRWRVNEPLSGFRAMQRIVTEQVGVLAAGTSPRECIDDLIFYFTRLMLTRVVLPIPLPLRTPRFRRAARRVEEFCGRVLKAHQLRDRHRPADVIDTLVELHRSDPAFMPETDLILGVLTPFILGLDTSASIATSMLYALLKHPELQERVREEADALFAGGTPTPEGIRAMDVTHRVALETMRMYPVLPAMKRTVGTSFDFGGHRFPAGQELLFATTVSHYLPRYFPDPERFDIDRYLPGRDEHRQPGAYAPFGLGAHRCLGAGFAEIQIALTVATLLREAVLELDPPDYELKMVQRPFASAEKRFRFRIVGRRQPA